MTDKHTYFAANQSAGRLSRLCACLFEQAQTAFWWFVWPFFVYQTLVSTYELKLLDDAKLDVWAFILISSCILTFVFLVRCIWLTIRSVIVEKKMQQAYAARDTIDDSH